MESVRVEPILVPVSVEPILDSSRNTVKILFYSNQAV